MNKIAGIIFIITHMTMAYAVLWECKGEGVELRFEEFGFDRLALLQIMWNKSHYELKGYDIFLERQDKGIWVLSNNYYFPPYWGFSIFLKTAHNKPYSFTTKLQWNNEGFLEEMLVQCIAQ
jgi:hypothetical protein